MSERSERIIITVFIAAQRRCAHWCAAMSVNASFPHDLTVHQ